MSAIRSKGNKSTEVLFLKLLKLHKITGWRRHSKNIFGRPDFSFRKERVAVFIDGCFWHGCSECYKTPKTNSDFWDQKIQNNINRDKKVNDMLNEKKWNVIRIPEHMLTKDPQSSVKLLIDTLH